MTTNRLTVCLDRGVRSRRSISRHRNSIKAVFALVIVVMFAATLMTTVIPSSVPPSGPEGPHAIGMSYTTHSRIEIKYDSAFLGSNATTGITTGSGTQSDPYIIEGWSIDVSFEYGIKIWLTDAYFVIRDCYITNSQYSAILLYDADNGCIADCVAYNNDDGGIGISLSNNVSVSNCTVVGNRHEGLYVNSCTDISISSVNCSDNDDNNLRIGGSADCTVLDSNFSGRSIGACIISSVNCTFSNNSFFGTGMFISGPSLENWNTHSIDPSNLVNGRPLTYCKDMVLGTAPSGAGELILANCSGTVIENETLSSASAGIILGFCSGIQITNNTISDVPKAIHIIYSNSSSVSNNTISDSAEYGVLMDTSIHNLLRNNTLTACGVLLRGSDLDYWDTQLIDASNTVNGRPVLCYKNETGIVVPAGAGQVILVNCTGMTVEGQNLTSTCSGILVGYSSNNTLRDNNCSFDLERGISLWYSDNNTLENNTCCMIDNHLILYYSRDYGIALLNSDNNSLSWNNCSDNGLNGLFLDGSSGNTVFNNCFSNNNRYGVSIWPSSENNTIWNNTFCHNTGGGDSYSPSTIQALDSGVNNHWNTSDGYGNWWSDLTGPDNLPPYGIVDWPYNISIYDVQDYYPLTNRPAMPVIPEFSDLAVPIAGLMLVSLAIGRMRKNREES